ncbi:hypothetical protein [Eggerthella sinensis]
MRSRAHLALHAGRPQGCADEDRLRARA